MLARSEHNNNNKQVLASKPKLPRRATQSDALGGPVATRDAIFAQADLTLARLAERLVADLAAIDAARSAVVVQRLVVPGAKGEGARVAEYTDIDHGMRLRAVDMDLSLVGGYPSRSAQGASGSGPGQIVNVNVALKDMSPKGDGQNALPVARSVPVVIDVDGTPIA